jgi:chromosome segregation ATPase
MDAKTENLNVFTTRVRQLMLSYKALKEENDALRSQVQKREEEIAGLKELANRLQHDYDLLKVARMMQITDGDIEEARRRLNKLIKNVSRSITLLNGQDCKVST